MIDVKLSYWYSIIKFETILLSENEYMNEKHWIELLVLDSNTWNHFPLTKQMISNQ